MGVCGVACGEDAIRVVLPGSWALIGMGRGSGWAENKYWAAGVGDGSWRAVEGRWWRQDLRLADTVEFFMFGGPLGTVWPARPGLYLDCAQVAINSLQCKFVQISARGLQFWSSNADCETVEG